MRGFLKHAPRYLGVFRRSFAPAIPSAKSRISESQGEVRWPRRVIVPGTLSGSDAHPRPEHRRNPKLLLCDWKRTDGLNPLCQQQHTTARLARPFDKCRVHAQEPRLDQTNELHDAGRRMALDSARAC